MSEKNKNSRSNTLSSDGEKIREGDKEKRNRKPDADGMKRAVFAKSKNAVGIHAYRFLGMYEQDKNSSGNTRTYTRVASEIQLQK